MRERQHRSTAACGSRRPEALSLCAQLPLESASAHQHAPATVFPRPETVSAATAGRPQPYQCHFQPALGRHCAQSARKTASTTKESRSSPCQTALHLWIHHEGGDPSPAAGPDFWCDVHGVAAAALLRADQPSGDDHLKRRQQQQNDTNGLQQTPRAWQWAAVARTPSCWAGALNPHCGWPQRVCTS